MQQLLDSLLVLYLDVTNLERNRQERTWAFAIATQSSAEAEKGTSSLISIANWPRHQQSLQSALFGLSAQQKASLQCQPANCTGKMYEIKGYYLSVAK